MPIVTTKPCESCGATGSQDGQPCPTCSGTGEMPLVEDAHDQTEFNVKYVVLKADDIVTKLETLDTKIDAIAVQVQVLFDDLNQ